MSTRTPYSTQSFFAIWCRAQIFNIIPQETKLQDRKIGIPIFRVPRSCKKFAFARAYGSS